jgi:gas vesicle protein
MKLTRLLALAAIGTGIAWLLASDKGKTFRKDIADRSGDLLKRLNKMSHNGVSDIAGKAGKAIREYV